jgi:hypothetical protein
MNRINNEPHHGKEILVADFSDLKEDQMIALLRELRNKLIDDKKQVLLLIILNDRSFATSGFMNAFRTERREETFPFIIKQAVIGLSETKRIILKGYNLLYNRNIGAFHSKEEALLYLTSE